MRSRCETFLAAFSLVLLSNSSASVLYVDLTCTNATPPFTNWLTAATNIQDAVDVALAGDEIVVTRACPRSGIFSNSISNAVV